MLPVNNYQRKQTINLLKWRPESLHWILEIYGQASETQSGMQPVETLPLP